MSSNKKKTNESNIDPQKSGSCTPVSERYPTSSEEEIQDAEKAAGEDRSVKHRLEELCESLLKLQNNVTNDENVNANAEPQPGTSKALSSQYAEAFRKITENRQYYEEVESNAFMKWRSSKLNPSSDRRNFCNFLLLDPRNSGNYSDSAESWGKFLSAIFYVGWSKSDDPYEYLRKARAKYNQENEKTPDKNAKTEKKPGLKYERTLAIWESGNGVIIIQMFQDCTALKEVEARKSAMIETLGREKLINKKKPEYDALIPENMSRKEHEFELGSFLLHKAFYDFLEEKGHLIFPLKVPQRSNRTSSSPQNSQFKEEKFNPKEISKSPLPKRRTPNYKDSENYDSFEKDKEHYEKLERSAFDKFQKYEPCTQCEKYLCKPKFFNYLLIDPRECYKNCATLSAKWQCFLSAIFYVGKGQGNRPEKHFQEAANTQQEGNNVKISPKSQRILDIWKSEKNYVIILRLFHNKFEEEAFTREALLIDSIRIEKLCQTNRGSYHGESEKWLPGEKRELGMYLLHQAFKEFCSKRTEDQELAVLDDS